MGKKSKKGSFDGKETSYDYLRERFNNEYRPHRADDESSHIYLRDRDNAFQRYLMTGDKYSGWDPGEKRHWQKKDKKGGGSFEEKLFKAGIPPSQFDYYAKKAGITNVNSKGDAKRLIAEYNRDERYQGEPKQEKTEKREEPTISKPAQDFKDKYVDEVIEATKPEPPKPAQIVGDIAGGDNSIVSPIQQDNDISVRGNRNTVTQDNSIQQMMNNMRESLRFAY
tara:strand:+ start:164 stop:835 length:672 start_codon:yes stop_codon:yes gene_type:complete